jgi:nucleotide-binding universal stress UspA family protein
MAQKILIAIDESENAHRSAELVAKSFSPDTRVTLFNVMLDTAAICNMNSPELIPLFKSQQSNFCALESKKRELVNAALERAKELFVKSGFSADRVVVKIEDRKRGVARDILAEAGKGYDLVVIGRRGLSSIKEFFLGSTSQKVLNGARDISVLIVN